MFATTKICFSFTVHTSWTGYGLHADFISISGLKRKERYLSGIHHGGDTRKWEGSSSLPFVSQCVPQHKHGFMFHTALRRGSEYTEQNKINHSDLDEIRTKF